MADFVLWDLSLRIDSSAGSLRLARRLVRHLAVLAGASDREASEVELSAGEALTNVHRYAYPDSLGPVGVEVQAVGSDFAVTVHDDGKAVTPPLVPDGMPDRRNSGGRGLYLIGEMMDTVEVGIDSNGHGVILRMTRRLGGPGH